MGFAADSNQNAAAFQLEASGYLTLRALYNEGRSESNSRRLAATALLKARLKRDRDLLALQVRPSLVHTTQSGFKETSAYVDELYWDHQFSPRFFTFLGRRKTVNGVAFGRNPSDFLSQEKDQDRTLSDEDRRAETVGDTMAGWSYFGRSYSMQFLAAEPSEAGNRIRAMLQASGTLASLLTDLSFIAYYADRPALGTNISTVLGNNATIYAETALRKGRDRQRPTLSDNNVLIGATDDQKRWVSDSVLGGQYTTGMGITLTAEYWRNNNGFSDKEYLGITNSLTSGQGNPHMAGSLMSTPGLRKNSAFFRIGDVPLYDSLKGELTLIHNIDDSSCFLRSSVNFDIRDSDSLRVGIDRFSGYNLTEYGSSKIDGRVFIIYKHYF